MQLPFLGNNFSDQVDFAFDYSFKPENMSGFSSFSTTPEDIVDIPGDEFDPNRISLNYKSEAPDPSQDDLFGGVFSSNFLSSVQERLQEYLMGIKEWVAKVTSSFTPPDLAGFNVPDDTHLPTSAYGLKNHAVVPGSSVPASSAPGESNGSLKGPANGKYDAWIEKYAAEHGVDPNVIKAIMAKESQGDPSLVSWAGAAGLMQVKPETASELLGRPVSKEELINDPELNIKVGVMYFAKMMQEKGNLEDALGAYNQGPNANWRSIPESVDYVESITTALDKGTLPVWA